MDEAGGAGVAGEVCIFTHRLVSAITSLTLVTNPPYQIASIAIRALTLAWDQLRRLPRSADVVCL